MAQTSFIAIGTLNADPGSHKSTAGQDLQTAPGPCDQEQELKEDARQWIHGNKLDAENQMA